MTAPTDLVPGTLRATPLLELASRGDALTPYLFAELERRFAVGGRITPELSRLQRLAVAAATFRPSRERWIERFYKSRFAYRLRSSNAQAAHRRLGTGADVVFQVHALFRPAGTTSVLYVDCTHRQVADGWPAWNPLRGRDLASWYADERATYARAAHLFAFYQGTADSLIEDYGIDPARVSVVGAGVNAAALPTLAPTRLHPGDAPVILFVGNDFRRKGGAILLEAFARLRVVHPGARLVLVGTPPALRPQPGVEVLGRLHDRERIARLYAEADVFALPSLFDPYPLVVLEAMAHGLPVVSTAVCGIPDMVVDGATGLLVEPGDPAALADALGLLLADPARARAMGLAGRARVEQDFLWSSAVGRMAPGIEAAARIGAGSC